MKKKGVFFSIVLVLIVICAILFLVSREKFVTRTITKTKPQLILYYGIGCPHCARVEEFLKNNRKKNLILLSQKEVYYNRDNQMDLVKKAKACGAIENGSIPIPLLWLGNDKCVYGDEPVIDYFHKLVKKILSKK